MSAEHDHSLSVEKTENTLFKRNGTVIKDKDGSTLLKVDYYEDGYYAISWSLGSFDPAAFLQSAQSLADDVASMPSVNPYQRKILPGLSLWKDHQIIAGSRERFMKLETLDITPEEFDSGRLNTPYGEFDFYSRNGETKLGVMSHIDAPGFITAFVMDNSEGNVPGYMVEDIVRKVCQQAGSGKINQGLQEQIA